ncbi:MAG: endolytic transglycosylase MltG [Actinomycetes bacterium]
MSGGRSRKNNSSTDPYQVLPNVQIAQLSYKKIVNRIAIAVVAVTALSAVIYGGYQYWYLRQVNPSGDPGAAEIFTVTETDDLVSMSKRLEQEGFIVNDSVFRSYVSSKGGLEVAAGFYTLKPHDHLGNILRVLRTPPNETLTKVTFPEGFTLAQMAQRLGDVVKSVKESDFLAKTGDTPAEISAVRSVYQPDATTSLEGMLFPDTYLISGDQTATQVAQQMLKLMERVGRQEGLDDSINVVGMSPYEVLTIASIIEREAKVAEDRAKISRVIYNRLTLGMPLEIDATLLYKQNPDLPFVELKAIDSPYNSYLHTGLPPTPIANPGRAAINAALNPAPNPSAGDPICREITDGSPCLYLYYVLADKNGHHKFAATLAQHQVNVQAAIIAGVL